MQSPKRRWSRSRSWIRNRRLNRSRSRSRRSQSCMVACMISSLHSPTGLSPGSFWPSRTLCICGYQIRWLNLAGISLLNDQNRNLGQPFSITFIIDKSSLCSFFLAALGFCMCGLFAALIVPVLLRWEKRCGDVRKWRAVSSRRIRLGLGREDRSQCGRECIKCLSTLRVYPSFRKINGGKGRWNSSSLQPPFLFRIRYISLSSLSKNHYIIPRSFVFCLSFSLVLV